MKKASRNAKKTVNNLIWYEICSEEDHYKEVISILAYAFEFLIRDGNECSVEVLIGDIDFVKRLIAGMGLHMATF